MQGNPLQRNLKAYTQNLGKRQIATTFSSEEIAGLKKFIEDHSYINSESQAIKFIIHQVLKKSNYIS